MRHWYQEIHRRGLWQAAAGFLAAAWIVIEVVDLLTSRGILPDWTFNGALIVLVIGLPVILATAYVQTPPLEDDLTDAEGSGPTVDGEAGSESATASSGVAGILTWRNALIGGVVAFALLGLATAGSTLFQVTGLGSDAEVDKLVADRIAVLPFGVRGSSDLEYLGEGIVDLLSAKLDGAGSLTTADPRAVIALAGAEGVDVTNPEDARQLASELRAGQYVTGDLLEIAGRVQLTASLHDTGQPGGAFQQATAEGESDEVFEVLDSLVISLLAGSMSADAQRLQALATTTSKSLEATKEYLRGEQAIRAGRYREAAEAYDKAITLDSTFALAYYRKSIAADWTDAYDIRSSADLAFEFSDNLPERARDLLNALRLRRNGRVVEAEQEFFSHLHFYTDDVEALVQLGESQFHDFPRRGRSIMGSIVPFRRALELEPGNMIAHLHLARLYALADSTARLAETAEYLAEFAPESERVLEVDAMIAFASGDTTLQRSVKNRLIGKPWYYRFYAANSTDRFVRDASGAEGILDERESDHPLLLLLVPVMMAQQGRYEETRAFLAQRSLQENLSWILYEAFVLTSGLMPPDEERMTELAAKLETLDENEILQSFWLQPYEDMTPRFAGFERDYFRALILIQIGRVSEARQVLDRMSKEGEFVGLGSVRQDALSELEAEMFLHSGDRTGALEVLRSMDYEVPHAVSVTMMPDQSRSRYLRGELEMELGDVETAKAFFVGLDEPWGAWDSFQRPLVYQRMGQIAEDEGRIDEAIIYYTRLLDLWQDCDPELVPTRDVIEARRNALVRASG